MRLQVSPQTAEDILSRGDTAIDVQSVVGAVALGVVGNIGAAVVVPADLEWLVLHAAIDIGFGAAPAAGDTATGTAFAALAAGGARLVYVDIDETFGISIKGDARQCNFILRAGEGLNALIDARNSSVALNGVALWVVAEYPPL